MSIIQPTLASLALALTLAMPVTAEAPAVVSVAKDEPDATAVIAKFKEVGGQRLSFHPIAKGA